MKQVTKKGAKWKVWSKEPANLDAFREMRLALVESAVLKMPDYAAAQDNSSGRPLELWVDACDYGWGGTLTQRMTRDGAPRPIAC